MTANRQTPRDPDPDDWFDEPDTADTWDARVDRLTRERRADLAGDAEDDWLAGAADRAPRRSTRRPRLDRRLLALGALAVVLVVGILAAAGVFSGSRPKVEAVSTASTPRPRSTPTTTAASTQARQPAVVPTSPLKPGDHGAAVSQLQRALAQAGYSPGTIDGIYGAGTTQAVTHFQQARGLTADGIAGPQTLAALERALQSG